MSNIYFIRFRPSSGGDLGSKLDQKGKMWVRLVLLKIHIFQRFFKHCFRLLIYYLWSKLQQNRTIFGGLKAQNHLKNGLYMKADLVCKALKIYNLVTTNAILMKPIAIMYLQWSRNSRNVSGINEKSLRMSLKINFLA